MSLFKRKSKDTGNDVYAFISGNTIPITEVNDPVFSAKTTAYRTHYLSYKPRTMRAASPPSRDTACRVCRRMQQE